MKRIDNNLFTVTMFVSLAMILFSSPVLAYPPDPDNAALLYYQGFLTLVELDKEAQDRIKDAAQGEIAPDDKVREDINKCKGAIQLAEAASKVPACNWGVQYSQGFDALLPQLARMRFLAYVLVADARIRASDGDYKGALERCLMTCTFADHVGDDTVISYLVSLAVRSLGYKCMQDVIGQAGGDKELMQWLKYELATSTVDTVSPIRPLKIEIEIVTDLMQMDKIAKLAGILADSDEEKIAEIIKKANKEILEQNRRAYTERMKSALTVMSMPMEYEKAHSQLKRLASDFDRNAPESIAAGVFIPALDSILSLKTRTETQANALKAAIDIYLRRDKTGRLADTLPTDSPKDLFSGKDFEYEKTKDGFVLRCRGRDLNKDEIHQYEFKVKK
jgi:hypothetical protein